MGMAATCAKGLRRKEEATLEVDLDALPRDFDVLLATCKELQRKALAVRDERNALEHRLEQELRARYGPRSEKSALLASDAAQALLFPEIAPQAAPAAALPSSSPSPRLESATPKPAKEHRGRRPLPAHLPRRRVLLDFEESERPCPCCQKPMRKIGEEVAERLEFDPATLHVIQEVRPKYACPRCHDGVLTAEPSPAPIEKGLPGPGLLAHVAVSKFADHLPLHRQEIIFKRQGVDIARQTLCDWVGATAALLAPIVGYMHTQILKSAKIHGDESPVPVLAPGEKKTHKSYLWVYVGDREHPFTVYDYARTRGSEWPLRFLEGYKGYLQADDYAGYEACYRAGVREVACWAHARRKFFEARATDPPRCERVLEMIGRLYAVERELHDATAEARAAGRRERSLPILEEIRLFLEAEAPLVLPKSPIGGAIAYTRKLWGSLTRYVDDGRLEIDNNRAERALRAVVIGRKNWLFAGSDEGGRRAAIIYSIVATCKENGVEPWAYLADVLARLPTYRGDVAALTPLAWRRAREALAR